MKHKDYDNVYVSTTLKDVWGNEFSTAFDLDSVLNELGEGLSDYLVTKFGTKNIRTYTKVGALKFHFETPGVSSDEMYGHVLEYLKYESPHELPTPHMAAVLEYVYSVTKVPICIVTARPKSVASQTFEWLMDNVTVPFVVYMVDGHRDKTKILHGINCHMFVDDRYRIIQEMRADVLVPILYIRPWNRNRDERFIECRDLRDVIPAVNVLFNRNPMTWPVGVPHPQTEKKGRV